MAVAPEIASYAGTFAGTPVVVNVQADKGFVANQTILGGSAGMTATLSGGQQVVVPPNLVLSIPGPVNTVTLTGTSGQTYYCVFSADAGSISVAVAGGGGGGGAPTTEPYLIDANAIPGSLPNSVPIRAFTNHLAFVAATGSGAGFEVITEDAVSLSAGNNIILETTATGGAAVLRATSATGGVSLQAGTGGGTKVVEVTVNHVACSYLELIRIADGTAVDSAASVGQVVDRVRFGGSGCGTIGGGVKYVPIGCGIADPAAVLPGMTGVGTIRTFAIRSLVNTCTSATDVSLLYSDFTGPPSVVDTITIPAGATATYTHTVSSAITQGVLLITATSPAGETSTGLGLLCYVDITPV
jgi:hypothetical protein